MTWRQWLDGQLAGIRAARRWRSTRSFDALGPTGVLDGRDVISFASNDYLGLSSHPSVVAAAVDAASSLGHRRHRLPPRRRHPARCTTSSRRPWRRGRAASAAVVFPTGYAANVGRARRHRRSRRDHLQRRAQPRLDRRRLPAEPRSAADRPATSTSSSSTPPWLTHRRTADRRHRHRVLDGRRRRRPRRAVRGVRPPRRAARARRGPRRPRPDASTPRRRRRGRARRHAVQDARLARRLRRRLAPRHRPAREPGPVVHLHDRALPPPTPPPPSPPSPSCAAPRAPRSSSTCGRSSTASRPATRRRSCPSCSATRTAPLKAADALLEQGLLVPAIRPPTVRAGHLPAAGRAVGRPHRRHGRPPGRRPRRARPAVTDRPDATAPPVEVVAIRNVDRDRHRLTLPIATGVLERDRLGRRRTT